MLNFKEIVCSLLNFGDIAAAMLASRVGAGFRLGPAPGNGKINNSAGMAGLWPVF